MPKPKSLYICNDCGAESSQWFGKCSACGTYNALEEIVTPTTVNINRGGWQSNTRPNQKSASKGPAQPRSSIKFSEISNNVQMRFASGYVELDRVLGGGIVPGSLVLIGGDPGIGKSTLLLQVANQLAQHHRILYVCAEESGQQVKLRASRLGVGTVPVEVTSNGASKKRAKGSESKTQDGNGNGAIEPRTGTDEPLQQASDPNLYVLPETDLEEVLRELESLKPQVAVIDSIQTL